jgi:opine dehydrogenase
MHITVLGGGHGCYAAAADLSEQGHEVTLWRRDAQALEAVTRTGCIVLKDYRGRRGIPIFRTEVDAGKAICGAELIVIATPAFSQNEIAAAIAPHLCDGQVVLLPPGTFGSYVMASEVRKAGNAAEVAYAETGTLPYLARKHGEAEVAITTRATRLPTGVFPASATTWAIATIKRAYPSLEAVEDALSAALMNAGPIIHPPLILMNAGPLEHFETWDIHNEGTQPSIRRVTDALDSERIALRIALGYGAPHFPLADHYNSDCWMYGNAHDKLVDSGDWREHIDLRTHRYMREDVAYGLAFLVSVAEWIGLPLPVASGLLAIGGAVCGEDLSRGPRTLRSLGLASLDATAMKQMLDQGVSQ